MYKNGANQQTCRGDGCAILCMSSTGRVVVNLTTVERNEKGA